MKCVIDGREKKSRKESAEKFFSQEFDGKFKTEIRNLTVGDYLFDDRVCFEYKTASDMIGSIIDGRVFKQARRMQQYPFSYIIVVGDVSETINSRNERNYWNKYGKLKQFTIKQYLGAVASLSVENKILHVKNQQQAFILMEAITDKTLKDNSVKKIDKPSFKLTDPIASFLGCIYVNDTTRLSMRTAVSIREYLHLESLEDLLQVTKKDLLKVKGVGEQTADAIMKVI